MTTEQFEEFLKSIGGLENGIFADREKINSRYSFCVGDGWLDLLKNLIEELIANGWDKQICDVKEKFGGLRFYTGAMSDKCRNIVEKYENLSFEICEKCGTPGELKKINGWLSTLCDECFKLRTKKI